MGRPIEDARAAFDRGEWLESYRQLSACIAHDHSTDDLDRLAAAAYLTGREQESFEIWARAHQECIAVADAVGATRFAVRLALGLGFKGDVGRAAGWVERGRRLLDGCGVECVEAGYLDHVSGLSRFFMDGDLVGARDLFVRASKTGDRFGDRELLAVARIAEGRCRIYLGEIAEGMALLDEAMISIEAREVSPLAVGDAYCTVIDACHELFDLRRCETWTASFTAWCESQPDLVLYRGHCLLHRTEVLQLHGAWSEALEAANDACARLAEPINLMAIGGARYVQGDLLRLRGELDEAERSYEEANRHGCEPQPGLSLLRLAQGRTDIALPAIRRVLTQAEGLIARARVLGAFAEIELAAGDIDAARGAASELTAVAVELASPYLRAQAAHVTGAVLLASGDVTGALLSLQSARTRWGDVRVPYEEARTRVLVAAACDLLGDRDGAAMERRAARAIFEELGAVIDLRDLDRHGAAADRGAPGGLTAREIEVVVLLSQGHTNRAIAERLFISEKTVASHVNHIFTKLGLSSRSAATAYAYEHQLVGP